MHTSMTRGWGRPLVAGVVQHSRRVRQHQRQLSQHLPAPTRTPPAPPTATRTPTATATPFPHPNVGVQVAPSGTADQLQTTITARDAACASGNNQLQALQFTKLTNAAVDVATSPVTMVSAPTTVSLPPHPATIGLTVRRSTAGLAATVELTVVDGCGTWPTFVGGGPSAF